jgi:UDP-2,3-diacylglucosamine pyrophosphatase LpxH
MNAPIKPPSPEITRHRYRAVWVSDMHLGTRDSQAEQFLSMMRHVRADYLCVIGDLIDMWQLRRRWYWPPTFNTVIQKLLRAARAPSRSRLVIGHFSPRFRVRPICHAPGYGGARR